jgi:hypothetical protein
MNVENNLMVGLTIMGIASFLASSSFLSLVIYFFKKIYFRGEVYISTIHTSLRQGILLSLSSMGIITFYSLGVLNPKT